MAKKDADPVMHAAHAMFAESGKTLEELGELMGYDRDIARKSAWQFLNQTSDPRLSMLRRFAKAMDLTLADLMTKLDQHRPKK